MNLDQTIKVEQGGFMAKVALKSLRKKTRIQEKRERLVLDGALEVFSAYGFHGATIDQIAAKADISKPNLLYYFRNKEHIYRELLERTLDGWLDPLIAIDPQGEPIAELEKYVSTKVDMSFDSPLPSRLFAIEVLNGAPLLMDSMKLSLKAIVDEKAAVFQTWMDQGKLRPVDPYHLIFSIWAVTQHYADFAIQVEVLLGKPPNRNLAKVAVLDILLRGLKP